MERIAARQRVDARDQNPPLYKVWPYGTLSLQSLVQPIKNSSANGLWVHLLSLQIGGAQQFSDGI